MTKIVIDGNIGCGKTTQLNLLEQIGLPVKREPIEKWPLDLFYSDKERWGLTFQLVVLQTLVTQEGSCIYERCPQSSKDIFWPLMKKTHIEAQVYDNCYNIQGWSPDIYILIDKKPKLCLEHIKKRTQEGDSGVDLSLLMDLDAQYQAMFDKLECPKFRVNGEESIESIHKIIIKIIKEKCPAIINNGM
jgi:deoxyadenosine/deoxycytidine kinase